MKIEAMVADLHTGRLAIKECDSEMIQSSGGFVLVYINYHSYLLYYRYLLTQKYI